MTQTSRETRSLPYAGAPTRARGSSRSVMLVIIIPVLGIVCLGCAGERHVSQIPLGGPYYLVSIKTDSFLSEPGGGAFEFRLLHRDGSGKMDVLSTSATGGWQQLFHDGHDARIYGRNLVYLEHYEVPSTRPSDIKEGIPSRRIRLMAYSEKNGFATIDANFQECKKTAGDQRGITCYRRSEDDTPTFYSAEYLEGL